jgi:uncharacterized delta-60 repeat protein
MAIVLCLSNGIARSAQFGQLDLTFSPQLNVTPGYVSKVVGAPDGKYFVSGSFHRVGVDRRILLVRIKADHTVDTAFDARLSAVSSIIKVLVQTDGKLLVHGRLFLADGTVLPAITRFNVDGTVDDSFQLPQNIGTIYGVTLVPSSQKIILNGLLLPTNNVASAVMIQLNTDGSIDSTFISAVKRGPFIRIEPVAGNKLMLIGSFSLSATTEAWETNGLFRPIGFPPPSSSEPPPRSPSPLRLNADGSVDGTFTNKVIPEYDSIYSIPDGGVYSALLYTTLGEGNTNAVQRFLPNGEKDLSFAPTFEAGFSISTLMPLKDGKLLVLLSRYNETERYDYVLQRLSGDGTVELEYETRTADFYSLASGSLESPDGSILMIDNSLKPSGLYKMLHKIHPDGEIETEVGPEFTAYPIINEIVPANDGTFYTATSIWRGSRSILNCWSPDGSYDLSFYAPAGETNMLSEIKLLANGDLIVLATSFDSYDRTLLRLNSTGEVLRQLPEDESGFYFNNGSWDVFPDGRVIVGRSGYSDEPSPMIKMFTAEFEADSDFNSVLNTDRTSLALIATPNRKILFGSYSTSSEDIQFFDERFLADGSPDPNYLAGTNRNLPSVFDAKNRMYVSNSSGGSGGSGNGHGSREVIGNSLPVIVSVPPVQRFLENGRLDTSFSVTLPTQSSAHRLWVQKDGRILAAGVFYNADRTRITTLIRFMPDGSLDESFALPIGEVVPISTVAVEADGNILIGGEFDQIGGEIRPGLARLKSVEQPQMKNVTFTGGRLQVQLDGNAGRTWEIQASDDMATWVTVSTITTGITAETVELPAPSAGSKFYRAVLTTVIE